MISSFERQSSMGDDDLPEQLYDPTDPVASIERARRQLHDALVALARTEYRGIAGAIRLQIQRILPGYFGSPITSRSMSNLWTFIHAVAEDGATVDLPFDREQEVAQKVCSVVVWPPQDLCRYLSEVSAYIRQYGSVTCAITKLRAEALQGNVSRSEIDMDD